jgi:glycosyltransferase involved in cell wall biosynthesis
MVWRVDGEVAAAMKVLFVHENTLGHGSYLPPFANYFAEHPELGIETQVLNATPLPPELASKADATIRGLRRVGLDNHFARWREVVSEHVRSQIDTLDFKFDAIVANTQSVGLDLVDVGKPLFVAFDATFWQLSEGRWFSDPPLGRLGSKLISKLIERERELFAAAARLLPWSQRAAQSAMEDYGIEEAKMVVLPPSVSISEARSNQRNEKPRALFIGGDFKRKGGDVLLKCFRERFRGRIELDIVTNSNIEAEEGVRVWRDIGAGSAQWISLWNRADLFIFPSRLETFGIVLVEALAFGVPVIASKAGAAEEILVGGEAGILLETISVDSLAQAIETVLSDPDAASRRAEFGRQRAMEMYNLATDSEKLAGLLR